MTSGFRIRQARELCKLTQKQLAESVEVAQSLIAQIEGNQRYASQELLEAIALQTGFPLSFFHKPVLNDFPMGSLLFRARTALRAGDQKSCYRYMQIASEIILDLSTSVNEVPLRIAPIGGSDPRVAAQQARSQLGLSPDQPVGNLTHSLERAGAYIVVLPNAVEQLDGFSTWVGDSEPRPFIAINAQMPVDRRRFTLAHELGELVIGRVSAPTPMERERLINQFASEFLLPEESMRIELMPPVTLTMLLPLKRRWGVSVQALVRTAKELKIISERQYVYLNTQIRRRGWSKVEPLSRDIPDEVPRAMRKLAELVYGNPVDVRRMARDVGVSSQFAETMLSLYREIPPKAPRQAGLSTGSKQREDSVILDFGLKERRGSSR